MRITGTRWLTAAIGSCRSVSDLAFNPIGTNAIARLAPALHVPTHFLVLLLQVEDKRFFFHPGADPIAVVRAVADNSLGNGVVQGASTITQQLYNTQRDAKGNVRRTGMSNKVLQTAWAIAKEAHSSKAEILQEYLNTVYWGRSYYGIDAATLGYFNTTRDRLNAAQSFFLVERLAAPNVVIASRVKDLLSRKSVLDLLSKASDVRKELVSIYEQHFGYGGLVSKLLYSVDQQRGCVK